jgi:four helix bundle protein
MVHEHASAEQLLWERSCPAAITSDVIWNLDVYRAALFLRQVARRDCAILSADRVGEQLAGQLARATGSVGANLGEGYSRPSRADRIRFLNYALGSTREAITWYHASSSLLPQNLIEERLLLLVRIRSLLLGLIKSLRAKENTAALFEP